MQYDTSAGPLQRAFARPRVQHMASADPLRNMELRLPPLLQLLPDVAVVSETVGTRLELKQDAALGNLIPPLLGS